MSTESEIQSDIEALRGRFPETKALYREVCALLFFRYGITPTTSKLYQYVRKGSMSAPADALSAFWEDLRSKARVEIDHPDLPVELRNTAAEAIATIWRQASAAARGELAVLRVEADADRDRAHGELAGVRHSLEEAVAATEAVRLQLVNAQEATRQAQTELEAERRAHAGSVATLQELQRQLVEARAQQERTRGDFAAELGKAREAVEVANGRADAAERRALLEIDQERQARSRADKQLETVRTQLAQTEARQRDEALERTDASARAQARLNAAIDENRRLVDANARLSADAETARAQLIRAQQEVVQLKTEVIPALARTTTGRSRRGDSSSSGRRRRNRIRPTKVDGTVEHVLALFRIAEVVPQCASGNIAVNASGTRISFACS